MSGTVVKHTRQNDISNPMQLLQYFHQTAETTNGATETHFNGGNTAASDAKVEGNVATFASNEHGLNFLSESEVESKPQAAVEPPAPVENLSERAPPESSGFGTQRADEGWVEQGGEAAAGDQGDNTGKKNEIWCNKYLGCPTDQTCQLEPTPVSCSPGVGPLFISCKSVSNLQENIVS